MRFSREDALLAALKSVSNCLNATSDVLQADNLIREIEATR